MKQRQHTPPGNVHLIVYGHGYQPGTRADPFTGIIGPEPGAGSYGNYNRMILEQCYRPNASMGNLAMGSFDFGPTLLEWMEREDPATYRMILAADRVHREAYGYGNMLAQSYNHTILPLMKPRDRETQIWWGIADFLHRFGRAPRGMWAPETAVDLDTLDCMARAGIQYTVLAPWQAAEPVDCRQPYLVDLPSGRTITVFFYHPLSGDVSFNPRHTDDANHFAEAYMREYVDEEKCRRGIPQCHVIATDLEFYGHWKSYGADFLRHLVHLSGPAHGFTISSAEFYLDQYPATERVRLKKVSSWSCPEHGVDRWRVGCSCDQTAEPWQRKWKQPYRDAFAALASAVDELYLDHSEPFLRDPWQARHTYLPLRNGWVNPDQFWPDHLTAPTIPPIEVMCRLAKLLKAQYYMQCAHTSCGTFFSNLGLEATYNIAYARKAMSLVYEATEHDLQSVFTALLRQTRNWQTNQTGEDLYLALPPIPAVLLPPLPVACA